MADDGENLSGAGPVWERRGRRSGGSNPIVGLVVTLLALFGALTAGLAIAERSVGASRRPDRRLDQRRLGHGHRGHRG
jgi:hypothetical protein